MLDGGNSREVGKMFQQVAATTGEDLGDSFNDAARRLTKGESIERVERDLAANTPSAPSAPHGRRQPVAAARGHWLHGVLGAPPAFGLGRGPGAGLATGGERGIERRDIGER